jgi:hypothetical protein
MCFWWSLAHALVFLMCASISIQLYVYESRTKRSIPKRYVLFISILSLRRRRVCSSVLEISLLYTSPYYIANSLCYHGYYKTWWSLYICAAVSIPLLSCQHGYCKQTKFTCSLSSGTKCCFMEGNYVEINWLSLEPTHVVEK